MTKLIYIFVPIPYAIIMDRIELVDSRSSIEEAGYKANSRLGTALYDSVFKIN